MPLRVVLARVVVALAALAGFAPQFAAAGEALTYLEELKGRSSPYLAPSEIDPRFTLALYVNVATSGPNKQRMWVLDREKPGGEWRLAKWDEAYWKKGKLAEGAEPPYSWLVSSGRVYRGDRKSGPTPTGIYGMDERRWRWAEGHVRAGMIHAMHIDFHTPDGKVTGVAFHGTPAGNYRKLGTNESHGCIRMHQKNALWLLKRLNGDEKSVPEDVRWGEVPRYWTSEDGKIRRGYRTDGKPIPAATPDAGSPNATAVTDAQPSDVLVKTGFRAIAVIFE